MKIMPHVRIGLTILGILLVAGAFFGTLYVGAMNNPPPLRIAIANRDLIPGERLQLTDLAVEDQVINPNLAELYVKETDIDEFVGTYIVDVVRRGDPLNKVKFAHEDANVRGASRYGLVLTNTNEVVMVLPVSPDVIPSRIKSADFINIIFAAGSSANLSNPADRSARVDISGANSEKLSATNAQTVATTDQNTPFNLSLTATINSNIDLPLADVLLEHVEILDVNYQQVQNQNYGSDGQAGSQPWLNGPISSIVVRVPRAYQTILSFAAANGKVRYAISSPMLKPEDIKPQAGVDWGQITQLYRWKRDEAVNRGETLTQTLYPGYVAAISGTAPDGIQIIATAAPVAGSSVESSPPAEPAPQP
jgi:hypothetical protein